MDFDEKYEILKTLKQSEKSCTMFAMDKNSHELYILKSIKGPSYAYKLLVNHDCRYIPKIYSCEYKKGVTYVVEQYIDGETIDKANLTPKQVKKAFIELCKAIAFLHKKNIIHRDIKPSNILVDKNKEIKLLDFDIARIENNYADSDTRLLGTKGYASPEQFGFAQTDKRSDIYSFGVTFSSLLKTKKLKRKYKHIIKKCTAIDRKKRFNSAYNIIASFYIRKYVPLIIYIPLFAVFIISVFCGIIIYTGINTNPEFKDDIDTLINQPFTNKDFVFQNAPIKRSDTFKDLFGINIMKEQPGDKSNHSYSDLISDKDEAYNRIIEVYGKSDDIYYVYSCLNNNEYIFGQFSGRIDVQSGQISYISLIGITTVECDTGLVKTSYDFSKYKDEIRWLYQMDFIEGNSWF